MKISKRKKKHNRAVAKECSISNSAVMEARAGIIFSEEMEIKDDPTPEPVLPIAVVVGGVLQCVFHPNMKAETEEESAEQIDYDLMDFDVFEAGSSDEEIAECWNRRAPSTQAYYKKFHPADAKKFTDAVRRHKRAQRK